MQMVHLASSDLANVANLCSDGSSGHKSQAFRNARPGITLHNVAGTMVKGSVSFSEALQLQALHCLLKTQILWECFWEACWSCGYQDVGSGMAYYKLLGRNTMEHWCLWLRCIHLCAIQHCAVLIYCFFSMKKR